MLEQTDSPPKNISPTLLPCAEEAMREAEKIKKEWDSLIGKTLLCLKNIRQLRGFKTAALIITILLSLIFLTSLPLTIIFPFTWMIILFLVAAASVGICLIGFGILYIQHQNALDDGEKFRNSSTAQDLTKKMLESRWKQAEIVMTKGSLVEIGQTKPNPATAICSRIYFDRKDDFPMTTEVFTKLFNELGNYKTAPLMAPFIYLLALAALGKHRRGFIKSPSDIRPKQQLTMILTTNYEIKYFFSHFGMTDPYGFYDTKNAIFVSLEEKEDLNRLKEKKPGRFSYIILHELAHFAAKEIMDNHCKPYPKQNDKVQKDYLKIVSEVKEAALQWKFSDKADIESENDAYLEALVIAGFQIAFTEYKESSHASELFVTIAQTIAILGYEKGYTWLKEHVPSLVKFYEEQFNPACIDYLKKYQVWEHIDVDPEFAKILGVNNENHHEQPFYGNVLHPGLKQDNLNNSAGYEPSKTFSHF